MHENGETSPCLIWTGGKNSGGYGVIRLDGKTPYVHVVAYVAAYNFMPPHLGVNHQCDNKLCVNPEHLRAGTSRENQAEVTERQGWIRGKRNGTVLDDKKSTDILDELFAEYGDR